MSSAPSRPGPGRRGGSADTRGDVLAAARQEFAARGYDATSVRGVARAAAVDPALVHHYFGTKEKLFVAAMELPFDPAELLPRVLAGDREGIGERLVRMFLGIWDEPVTRAPVLALLRAATSSEQGAQMMRQFVASALLARIAAAIDPTTTPEERELRAGVTAAQLLGVALLRHVVGVEPVRGADQERLVELIAPTVQRYLVPGA